MLAPPQPIERARVERALFVGILGLALAVRLAIAARTPLIGADSARFLRMAYRIAGGRISLALRDPYHPLYPAIVAAAYRALGMPGAGEGPAPPAVDLPPGAIDADFPPDTAPLERVATAVGVAAGVLLVALLHGLARSMLGVRIALLAGLIAACHPLLARLSADIMSDTTALAAYTGTLWALRSGIAGRRLAPLALAGFSTGLAYLARPEGIALLACAIGGLAFARARLRWKLGAAAVVAIACAIPAGPYAGYLSAREGGLLVTGKKLLPEFFWVREARTSIEASGPPAPADDPAPPPRPPKGILRLLPPRLADLCWIGFTFHLALPEALLGCLILAVLLRHRIRASAVSLPLCAAAWAIHAALLARLLAFVGDPGYLSRRHVLPMVVASLPWAVAGIDAAAAWIVERRPARRLRAKTLSALLAAAIGCAYLAPALAPPRQDQLAQKEAGLWLRPRILAQGGLLYTTREKVAYYARSPYIPLGEAGARASLEAPGKIPRFLAFYRDRDVIAPAAAELIRAHPERATPIALFRERSGRVLEIHAWR